MEDGGSQVVGYRVEWFETDTVRHEVQAVRLTWESGDEPGETFQLSFKGQSTLVGMDPDVSYINMRDALMNINDNSDFLVGHIDVERSTINGDEGYVYTTVFEDSINNAGDQPMLTPIDTFTGTGSIRVYEVTSGIRAGGAPEVQRISIGGTGDGLAAADAADENPDEAIIGGYWRAQFAASNFRWVILIVSRIDTLAQKHVVVDGASFDLTLTLTKFKDCVRRLFRHRKVTASPMALNFFLGRSTYVSSVATTEEVEAALEGLEPTGDLTVTRSINLNNGYDWQVNTHWFCLLCGAEETINNRNRGNRSIQLHAAEAACILACGPRKTPALRE